jgi:hypothetical protein
MKLEYSRRTVEKISDIEFRKNPFSGNRVSRGQTDRREANSRYSPILRTPLRTKDSILVQSLLMNLS